MMQNFPLVSIVTPSFNQAPYLEQTIESILAQDYPNIEYILMDGGSTDKSVEIIKKYQDRISYWVSEPDQGQSDAINKGFSRSTGEILNWVNSDDLLEPSAVSIAVYYLLKYPESGMVFGDRVYIDGKNNILRAETLPAYRLSDLRWGAYIPQETAFWRRHLFFDLGLLDVELQTAMDTDLWFRMDRATKIKHIPAILGRYREHGLTKTAFSKSENSTVSVAYQQQSRAVRDRYGGNILNASLRAWFLRLYKFRVPFEKRFNWCKEEIRQIKIIQRYGLVEACQLGLLDDFPPSAGA